MISVIMSIKNNQYSLENAIESILSQTYKNFEFLIIDDNSTDNSFEMLKNYELKDQRVKLFKNDDRFKIQKEIGESSWFGFSLIINNKSINRKSVIKLLGDNNIDCRPIVTGNFARNEVMKYFNYSIHNI